MLGGLLTVETVMFFGIGFLLAAALGVAVAPAVHSRAVRLTTRQLDAAMPLSMKDMQADKDHLRVKFAVATRQLETSIENLKSKTMAQVGELGKKTETIGKLKTAVEEKSSAVLALEAREKALEAREKELRGELRATKDDAAAKASALADAERTIAAMQSDISRMTAAVERRERLLGSQHDDIVALTARARDVRRQPAAPALDAGQDKPRSTEDLLEFGKSLLRRNR
jgi:chromosome segregation ATPase